MSLVLAILGTAACLALLSPLSDEYLVADLFYLADKRDLSEGLVGSILLAISSSAPELMIALVSVVIAGGAHAGVGAGTIVGSALFNLLVIVGVSGWMANFRLGWRPLLRDNIAYAIGVGWLVWAMYDGRPELFELGTALGLYAAYLAAVAWIPDDRAPGPGFDQDETDGEDNAEKSGSEAVGLLPPVFLDKTLGLLPAGELRLLVSVLTLAGLSWGLVECAVIIAHSLDLSKELVGLTILAVGTSVPDLFSSMAAARRNEGGVAVANAIGSNVFDILPGLALPWLLALGLRPGQPIALDPERILIGSYTLLGSIVLLLGLFALGRGRLTRPAAALLWLAYGGWVGMMIML